MVTIELLHSGKKDAVGFIERMDGVDCYFHSIPEDGEDGDALVVRIDSITLMTCDGVNERMLENQAYSHCCP